MQIQIQMQAFVTCNHCWRLDAGWTAEMEKPLSPFDRAGKVLGHFSLLHKCTTFVGSFGLNQYCSLHALKSHSNITCSKMDDKRPRKGLHKFLPSALFWIKEVNPSIKRPKFSCNFLSFHNFIITAAWKIVCVHGVNHRIRKSMY